MATELEPPPPGGTSLRFGKAFLQPSPTDPDHYDLMRPVVAVRNEGDRVTVEQSPDHVMKVAIYRKKRRGDRVPTPAEYSTHGPPPMMRTSDPRTGEPLELLLAWWPGQQEGAER